MCTEPLCALGGARAASTWLAASQMGKLSWGCHTACPGPNLTAGLGSRLTLVAQSVAPIALWEQGEGQCVWPPSAQQT